ncbi:MAG TPA: cob(I)yrinic acid a,c-diamide adenosyltransferase [bacterium]
MKKRIQCGYVQVYTGDGKGKTTAALGLAMRAVGHGFRVYMVQFMKGQIFYGELAAAGKLYPNFVIKQAGRPDFVNPEKPEKIDIKMAKNALKHSEKVVSSGKYDIVILDEINVAVKFNLLNVNDVLKLIKIKPSHVELILTGRYADPKILKAADLVTEMRLLKHYYNKGIMAREGIER